MRTKKATTAQTTAAPSALFRNCSEGLKAQVSAIWYSAGPADRFLRAKRMIDLMHSELTPEGAKEVSEWLLDCMDDRKRPITAIHEYPAPAKAELSQAEWYRTVELPRLAAADPSDCPHCGVARTDETTAHDHRPYCEHYEAIVSEQDAAQWYTLNVDSCRKVLAEKLDAGENMRCFQFGQLRAWSYLSDAAKEAITDEARRVRTEGEKYDAQLSAAMVQYRRHIPTGIKGWYVVDGDRGYGFGGDSKDGAASVHGHYYTAFLGAVAIRTADPSRSFISQPITESEPATWSTDDAAHQLIITSLHDAQASCSCGGWTFARTGAASREHIQRQHSDHAEASVRASLGLSESAKHDDACTCEDCGPVPVDAEELFERQD